MFCMLIFCVHFGQYLKLCIWMSFLFDIRRLFHSSDTETLLIYIRKTVYIYVYAVVNWGANVKDINSASTWNNKMLWAILAYPCDKASFHVGLL